MVATTLHLFKVNMRVAQKLGLARAFLKKMRSASPALIIVMVGLLLTLPMLIYGFWPFTYDARCHVNWYSNFSSQLWGGEPYPRWLLGMNDGLGSPVMFYYPPGGLYFTSLLKPLFRQEPHEWYQLGASVSLALISSGITSFIWVRRVVPGTPALIAAIIYMILPHHLRTDLYVRGAFAEFWSFAWMPLILYFVHGVCAGQRIAFAGLGLSYCLLIITHLPTALVFSLVPVGYALVCPADNRRKAVLELILGMTLGLGLSAIYLVPALTTQPAVSMEEMRRDDLFYEASFLFANFNFKTLSFGDGFKTSLYWLIISMVLAAVCMWLFAAPLRGISLRRERHFWGAVALLAFLMMLPVSKPIWRLAPPLQAIQFPWRFGTVLSAAMVPLAALAVGALRRPVTNWQLVLLLVCWVSGIGWIAVSGWAAWEFCSGLRPSHVTSASASYDAPEYRPHWVKVDRDEVIERFGSRKAAFGKLTFLHGRGDARIEQWQPRQIVLHLNADQVTDVLVHQFYYPGWTAWLDGQPTAASPSEPDGLVSVRVTAGPHRLHLRLQPLWPERAGKIVTAMAGLATVVLAVVLRRRKGFNGHQPQTAAAMAPGSPCEL